jgi:hypothetical protein
MTEFQDLDEPGFVAVTGELRQWCKELSSPSPGGARIATVGQQRPPIPQESSSGNAAE